MSRVANAASTLRTISTFSCDIARAVSRLDAAGSAVAEVERQESA